MENKSSETLFLFFSSSQLEPREHKGVSSPGPNELDKLFFQTVCYFRSPTIWPVLSGVETDRQTAERRGVFSMYSHLSARINFCSVFSEFSLQSLVHMVKLWKLVSTLPVQKPLSAPLSINYSKRSQLELNNLSSECQYLVNNLMQLLTSVPVWALMPRTETASLCGG